MDNAIIQRVHLEVLDRDIGSDQVLAVFNLTYQGTFPLTTHDSYTNVECRAMTRDELEGAWVEAAVVADRALDAMDVPPTFTLQDERWAVDPELRERLYEAVSEIAGLVGWDDPRVRARTARVGRILERAAAAIRNAVAEAARTSPPASAPYVTGSLTVRAVSVCGQEAERLLLDDRDKRLLADTGCALRLEVKNRSSRAVTVGQTREGELQQPSLVTPDAMLLSARFIDVGARRTESAGLIEPNQTGTFLLVPGSRFDGACGQLGCYVFYFRDAAGRAQFLRLV